ncbi:MAG: molybdenum cofactor biosynthesis protein [Deltaproteobacteria bacterium]
MRLTILFFAAAREAAGTGRAELSLPEGTGLDGLRAALDARFPALGRLWPYLQIAVDRAIAPPGTTLCDGQEIALLPPVAGGAGLTEGRFRLSVEPIALAEAERLVVAAGGPAQGGLVLFAGKVRGESHGRRVLRLEYEAYGPMAEAQLCEIGRRIEQGHGVQLAILHRVGTLAVGEVAVAICAAAPHRQAAFRGCEAAIDLLKAEAAIWKREVYEDGDAWVGMGP